MNHARNFPAFLFQPFRPSGHNSMQVANNDSSNTNIALPCLTRRVLPSRPTGVQLRYMTIMLHRPYWVCERRETTFCLSLPDVRATQT